MKNRLGVKLATIATATLIAASATGSVEAQESRGARRPTPTATLRIAGSREVEPGEKLWVRLHRLDGGFAREREMGGLDWFPKYPWAEAVDGDGLTIVAGASYRIELHDAIGALPGAAVEIPPSAEGGTRRVALELPRSLGDVRIKVPAFAGAPGRGGRSHFVWYCVAPEGGWPATLQMTKFEWASSAIARDGSTVLGPVYRPHLAACVTCRHGVGQLLVAPSADRSRPPYEMQLAPSRGLKFEAKSPGGRALLFGLQRITDRKGVPIPVGFSRVGSLVPQVELVAHGVVLGRSMRFDLPAYVAFHEIVVPGVGEIVFRRSESRPSSRRVFDPDKLSIDLRPVRVPTLDAVDDRYQELNWLVDSGQVSHPFRKHGGRIHVWEGVWKVQVGRSPAVEVTVRSGESVEFAVR